MCWGGGGVMIYQCYNKYKYINICYVQRGSFLGRNMSVLINTQAYILQFNAMRQCYLICA